MNAFQSAQRASHPHPHPLAHETETGLCLISQGTQHFFVICYNSEYNSLYFNSLNMKNKYYLGLPGFSSCSFLSSSSSISAAARRCHETGLVEAHLGPIHTRKVLSSILMVRTKRNVQFLVWCGSFSHLHCLLFNRPRQIFNRYSAIIFLWKTAFCSIASELWDPQAQDQCRPVLLCGTNNPHLTKN